jgi:L-Ala-D/L-Glu epimerase
MKIVRHRIVEHPAHERDALILILEDELGLRGFGEASPLPGHSPDTIAQCREELSQIDWNEPTATVHSPAARFAIETALLDLRAQSGSTSISSLLGAARESVPLSSLISASDEAGAIEEAQRAIDRGITTVKVKLGRRALDRDVAIVAALRRTFGDRIAIRLDANGRWTPDEAAAALRDLEPYAPQLIEEPIALRSLPDASPVLAFSRLAARIPIALDESLQHLSTDHIRTLAQRHLVDALVLKPMALGGFSRCFELARLAADLDLPCILTHLFDGPIALAAAAELALALPCRLLACGLDRHPGLAAWPSADELRNRL